MLAAGAGALYLAQFGSWRLAYETMAALVIVGIAGMTIAPEPEIKLPKTGWRAWLDANKGADNG